jgi:integrase
LLPALNKALDIVVVSIPQRQNIKTVLKFFTISAQVLKYDALEIQNITRKHIRIILDHCEHIRPDLMKLPEHKGLDVWTNSTFNRYRKELSSLFGTFEGEEIIETNPVAKIALKPVGKKLRETLTIEERRMIDRNLKISNYRLWRLMHVFFHSGARRTEIVQLQRKNVDLAKQEFKILVMKKAQPEWVIKPIKNIVLPLWKELMQEAIETPGGTAQDYLFSTGLRPRSVPVRPEQITRRWKRWVKEKMGIEADFYSLKHSNSDEIDDLLGIDYAASLNDHSIDVAINHYAIGHGKRDKLKKKMEREKLKHANNVFA